jgi:ABC-type Zn uptake system ZnuABC Zn-binding protein ZnuA
MNRRNFLIRSVSVGVGMLALSACGSSSTAKQTGGGASANESCGDGASTVYTSNAVPGDYTLMGGSHPHDFSLTAQDFIDLRAGQTILKTDVEGHGHILSITC